MSKEIDLAEMAYKAWCLSCQGLGVDLEPLPPWHELHEKVRQKWKEATETAMVEMGI